MKRFLCAGAACGLILSLPVVSSAHYLWVRIDAGKDKQPDSAHVIFEEGPRAGSGEYNAPFIKRGKTWVRTVVNPDPKPLAVTETIADGKKWLSGELPVKAPRSVDSYGMFGVYRYGNTDVLLHYYARSLDLSSHEDLHELSRAEQMDLDIVAHELNGKVELRVLWKGQPAVKRNVFLRGPKSFRKTLTTDEKGYVQFQPTASGQYLFRTFIELKTPGKFAGQDYQLVRHHATLSMALPLKN